MDDYHAGAVLMFNVYGHYIVFIFHDKSSLPEQVNVKQLAAISDYI